MLFFQQKKCLLSFLSLALDLSRPLSRWASVACRPLSLFVCLSLALYSKFVDFIDSLVVSASQDAGGNAISRQNNLSYIWVAIPVEWVILHWYACGADGRSVGRCTVTWLPNFLGWVVYHIFLPMVLRCARFARESSAINACSSCKMKLC